MLLLGIKLSDTWLTSFNRTSWVQSDMGNQGARLSGLTEAPVTITDCAEAMISKIDNATREDTSGKFLCYDDERPPW
jgi:norsolorinic acid ketoreductase